MHVFRGVVAVALVLFGCWCLLWLALFTVLALFATGSNPIADYLLPAAWVPLTFGAAYLVQPRWTRPSRRCAVTPGAVS